MPSSGSCITYKILNSPENPWGFILPASMPKVLLQLTRIWAYSIVISEALQTIFLNSNYWQEHLHCCSMIGLCDAVIGFGNYLVVGSAAPIAARESYFHELSFKVSWVLTISREWYRSNGGVMRLHFHNHLDFSQIKYSNGSITVASHTVGWLDHRFGGCRMRVDSCNCLSLIGDWLCCSGFRHWAERHRVAGLEKIQSNLSWIMNSRVSQHDT